MQVVYRSTNANGATKVQVLHRCPPGLSGLIIGQLTKKVN